MGPCARDRPCSDNDINRSIPLYGFKTLETVLAVTGAFAGFDVEFPAMPWADDMQVGFAEPHALIGLVGRDDFLDAVDQQSIANGTALMRTDVQECVQLVLGADDTDLPAFVLHRVARTLRQIRRTRHENLSHRQSSE